MRIEIIHGEVAETVRALDADSFDAVLCDPPYGLRFMGRRWDYSVPSAELWAEVLRVCKPGAHMLACQGSRTAHRGVVAIEDGGFEIRDQIDWLYGNGFPKSLDVSKALDKAAGVEREVVGERVLTGSAAMSTAEKGGTYAPNTSSAGRTKTVGITAPATDLAHTWDGFGTALKPAHEPIILARKPLDGTVAENVAKWGVGGLAIDACRIVFASDADERETKAKNAHQQRDSGARGATVCYGAYNREREDYVASGRWPANVLLDAEAAAMLDEQSGNRTGAHGRANATYEEKRGVYNRGLAPVGAVPRDSGGASRFFYTAKASKRERGQGNTHPTVKPLALTTYLARLIQPPKPGRILVPFSGSGSEIIGAIRAGWTDIVGIELEADYVRIARERVRAELGSTPFALTGS